MINVRRAVIEDIPMIMQFLDEHWLKGYALAHNRELFDWQFIKDGKVNIWIGVDDEKHELFAMQGAVIYSDSPNPDISGILWVAKKSDDPLLAFAAGDAMFSELKPRYSPSPGIAPRVAKMHRAFGNSLINLDHYYRLGDAREYKIACVRNKIIPSVKDDEYSIFPLVFFEDFKKVIPERTLIESVPSKDYRYIEWRYYKHPLFQYDVWGIRNRTGIAEGVLITREETANGAKSCKIVDLYGDSKLLGKVTLPLDRLIAQKNYEYVDVYSFGVPTSIYKEGGFVKCDVNADNIITNLFQPYTCVNSEITMVDQHIENLRLFRGDSDQDKPRY